MPPWPTAVIETCRRERPTEGSDSGGNTGSETGLNGTIVTLPITARPAQIGMSKAARSDFNDIFSSRRTPKRDLPQIVRVRDDGRREARTSRCESGRAAGRLARLVSDSGGEVPGG